MGGHSRAGKRTAWARAYRTRISNGLETCRNCGVSDVNLTWGHLVPDVAGGRVSARNVTILCRPCNLEQGHSLWGHLTPLADEPDFGELVAGYLNVCVVEDRDGSPGFWSTAESVLTGIPTEKTP